MRLDGKKRGLLYDEVLKIWNDNETNWKMLNREVFEKYSIYTIRDLEKFLAKKCEYGGLAFDYVHRNVILLPFHHDYMNSWLKFDNIRVRKFYEDYYENNRSSYQSIDEYKNRFFEIEESVQLNNWVMPNFDERILKFPIMGCWDKVELEALFLETHGKEVRRVCCHDGNKMRGHTFLCFSDAGKWKTYLTSMIVLNAGSFEKLCKKAHGLLKHIPIYSNPNGCELIEYEKPPILCKGTAFVDILEKGTIVIPFNNK